MARRGVQVCILSDSLGQTSAEEEWRHQEKAVLLELATKVLELLQPQSKSSPHIFFNPVEGSNDEEEDLLREVSSLHKDLYPNEAEAFLDAYVLQIPPNGLISINSQQLPAIESASPPFRQNAPQKTTLEDLYNNRVARHLQMATLARLQTNLTQAGKKNINPSNRLQRQLAPHTPGA
jgi:hypothetical protein